MSASVKSFSPPFFFCFCSFSRSERNDESDISSSSRFLRATDFDYDPDISSGISLSYSWSERTGIAGPSEFEYSFPILSSSISELTTFLLFDDGAKLSSLSDSLSPSSTRLRGGRPLYPLPRPLPLAPRPPVRYSIEAPLVTLEDPKISLFLVGGLPLFLLMVPESASVGKPLTNYA